MSNDVIRCPVCGYAFNYEDTSPHISYSGEDPPKHAYCAACDAELLVDEKVTRTFDVTLYQ